MLVRVEQVGTVTVLTLTDNKLDASNQDDIYREIEPSLGSGAKLLLDLNKVEFVDSTGCNLLLRIVRRLLPTSGHLKVGGIKPRVRDTFHLVGLQRHCDLYDTAEEAIKAYGEPTARPA